METYHKVALDQLKKAVILQKTINLPETPPDPSFTTFHSRVMEYDRFVTETVIGVIGGSRIAEEYPMAARLEAEIDQMASAASRSEIINLYRNYKHRLDQLLALAIEVTKER